MTGGATLRELAGCRLCRRIALAVFGLILAIESVILVPSALRFERDLVAQRIDHAMIVIEPALAAAQYGARADDLDARLAASIGLYGVRGVLLADPAGRVRASAGDVDGLDEQVPHAAPMGSQAKRRIGGTTLDTAWPTGGALVAAARIDTSGVRGEVLSYAMRVAGLVLLIVAVVTAGTMVVLHRQLLRPILALRRSSMRASDDPDGAKRHTVENGGRDELGDLVAAHNGLLERVADSRRRDRERAAEHARFLSLHDRLTGLPNRAALLQFLDSVASEAAPERSAVVLYLVNLVGFGVLNATLGAVAGDAVLRRVAARLRDSAHAGDFVAHFGGDRFAVVRTLPAMSADSAAAGAERILAIVALPGDGADEAAAAPKVQIGVASVSSAALDGGELVAEAELALARARGDEAARIEYFAPALAEQAKVRHALARDLEAALEARDQLFVVLQPKFELRQAGAPRLCGAEVLVRWRHPAHGLVSPAQFIPVAESTGLVVPLGERVLGLACALARSWIDRRLVPPRLAVNLSAREFALPDLEQRLERALARAGIAPTHLEVEVTESAAMQDVTRTAEVLARLRALGVKVSVDDFGTGYSSLAYLRRFAVDAVKIDKSFVDDIGTDRNAEAICDAILRLGQALGCRVVAEGVENERQEAFLRHRRCDEVQGFRYGRPVSGDEFEATWLAARPASPLRRYPTLAASSS